jgi:hypothetical protein
LEKNYLKDVDEQDDNTILYYELSENSYNLLMENHKYDMIFYDIFKLIQPYFNEHQNRLDVVSFFNLLMYENYYIDCYDNNQYKYSLNLFKTIKRSNSDKIFIKTQRVVQQDNCFKYIITPPQDIENLLNQVSTKDLNSDVKKQFIIYNKRREYSEYILKTIKNSLNSFRSEFIEINLQNSRYNCCCLSSSTTLVFVILSFMFIFVLSKFYSNT